MIYISSLYILKRSNNWRKLTLNYTVEHHMHTIAYAELLQFQVCESCHFTHLWKMLNSLYKW